MRLPRLMAVLSAFAALAAALAFWNAFEPFANALSARLIAAAALVALAIGLAHVAARRWRRTMLLPALLWVMAGLVGVTGCLRFALFDRTVRTADIEIRAALGPHFIVGYRDAADASRLAESGLIAGIYVTRRNVEAAGGDLAIEIKRMQQARRHAGLPPLIVAADQEGGLVSHLSPPLTRFEPLSRFATMPPADAQAGARAQGEAQGRELAGLGITLNLAPVIDLYRPKTAPMRDVNSFIDRRAISADPAITGAIASAYIAGLRQAGIGAAAKHFPGLARIDVDTHLTLARLETPRAELETTDFAPFRTVSAADHAMIMVGHVVVTALDPVRPASHSAAVIDGVIRRQWGFDGPIITDDLVMGAIYNNGLCEAVVDGLNAGADLLLLAYDPRQYRKAMACAIEAYRGGRLDKEKLRASSERLARYRAAVAR